MAAARVASVATRRAARLDIGFPRCVFPVSRGNHVDHAALALPCNRIFVSSLPLEMRKERNRWFRKH